MCANACDIHTTKFAVEWVVHAWTLAWLISLRIKKKIMTHLEIYSQIHIAVFIPFMQTNFRVPLSILLICSAETLIQFFIEHFLWPFLKFTSINAMNAWVCDSECVLQSVLTRKIVCIKNELKIDDKFEYVIYLMETRIMAKIKYFPSSGTTNDVGGIISTTSKKNTWRLIKIDIESVTCSLYHTETKLW